MARDVLIRVDDASKKFCRSLRRSLWYGVQDMVGELAGSRRDPGGLRADEFWAVDRVSFEVARGECIGLIGRNGAGKTTLLRMLNGLIKPDRGRIEMHGRVGALIALGTGFNPVLTGRENIYVSGSLLGLSRREIDGRLADIVSFADIGAFIDSPVQTYSSGMQVRLGFAVATALVPDVLLVDEVLAVGDTAFRIRCHNRIREILPHTAVILVSHSMHDVARICSSVLVLDRGQVAFQGDRAGGIAAYEALNLPHAATPESLAIHRGPAIEACEVRRFEAVTAGAETRLGLRLAVRCRESQGPVRVRVLVHDDTLANSPFGEWDSHEAGVQLALQAGDNELDVDVAGMRLRTGAYRVRVAVADPANVGYHVVIDHGLAMHVQSPAVFGAPYRIAAC